MLRIGVDVDGVLADFNYSFITRVVSITRRDLFPKQPFTIETWNYPEAYGYTREEVSKVWEDIKADPWFWFGLPVYKHTEETLQYLASLQQYEGHDVYFITARPGINAKRQTERWLERAGFKAPTVLISSHKGYCARALNLDLYVDDRLENVEDVIGISDARVFLFDQPWNQDDVDKRVTRTDNIVEAFERDIAIRRQYGVLNKAA